MRRSSLVALVVVLLCALSAGPAVRAAEPNTTPTPTTKPTGTPKPRPPAKSRWEPKAGGAFNIPAPWGSWGEQHTIVRSIEAAINHVPGRSLRHPNPTITVATFLLDRRESADALIAACKRGVAVRVILDQDVVNPTSRRLFRAFNGDNVHDRNGDGKPDERPRTGPCGRHHPHKPHKTTKANHRAGQLARATGASARVAGGSFLNHPVPIADSITWGRDRSYAMYCHGSCRGGAGNMHSKFFLMSESGGADDVVMVSSSNLNAGGAINGWNDLYVVKNRPRLYEAFVAVHRAMAQETPAGRGRTQITVGPYTVRVFPMRRAGKGNDPTLADLRQVRCHSGFGRTSIHISMFYWKGRRGNHLADKVLALARSGCRVSIVLGAPSNQVYGRLRAAAASGRIALYDTRWGHRINPQTGEGLVPEVRTHAKYVLIRGGYRGDRKAHVVMTGTQNWVGGSLAVGDEVSLNIQRRSAYRSYLQDWSRIRDHSRRVP